MQGSASVVDVMPLGQLLACQRPMAFLHYSGHLPVFHLDDIEKIADMMLAHAVPLADVLAGAGD